MLNSIKKKNSLKQKKRKGFTLTELIAVMAIVAILATAMIPKVVGYVEEGKKTNAIEEARQIVLAVDSYNITADTKIAEDAAYSDFISYIEGKNYVDSAEIKYIEDKNTYKQLKGIVKGSVDFSISDTNKIVVN